jgi:diguanylate cyclase
MDGKRVDGRPLPIFEKNARLANASLWYNYQNASWLIPFNGKANQLTVPSFASAMAGVSGSPGERFRSDYSINPHSIPYLSASDLIRGKVLARQIRGKTLILGLNSDELGDRFWVPGYGRMAGATVHIVGAETLKSGRPVDLGWMPAWIMTLLIISISLIRLDGRPRATALAGTALVLLAAPVPLDANLIFADVTPAIFLAVVVGIRLTYLRWRSGGLVNSITGLPNLTALRRDAQGGKSALVAARVQNFAEIASTMTSEGDSELVRQIVSRLSAGGTANVFQGDEGIFAWYADSSAAIGNHLEALHAMFRSPVRFENRSVDLALTFGVELGSNRSAANRLGSALVAADEAWAEGLRWKYYDPSRQEEASWRLSLLGQLDAAIDNGEVWIAYQPQFDLQRGTVIGAEALARWTHPEKGPISPTEFVAAAEQQGRIGKLTDFVLDRSIATAAAINRRGIEFTVAVNMSARLLSDRQLLDRVQTMLKAHGLPPERLTLELTETEALHAADGGVAMLDALRASGVRIAIDDYGTGLSTLDYLKKVPANEIKIDQSFVKAMRVNRSDLIMVQSTIALAHSLGRTVVAEGVEDRQCLDELSAMGCDVAQGYIIGRPMGVRELVQRLQTKQPRKVA